jgi:hypothetical protein
VARQALLIWIYCFFFRAEKEYSVFCEQQDNHPCDLIGREDLRATAAVAIADAAIIANALRSKSLDERKRSKRIS